MERGSGRSEACSLSLADATGASAGLSTVHAEPAGKYADVICDSGGRLGGVTASGGAGGCFTVGQRFASIKIQNAGLTRSSWPHSNPLHDFIVRTAGHHFRLAGLHWDLRRDLVLGEAGDQ